MVHLVSVHDAFHARVIVARLGSDGILAQVRGALDGPYPLLGEVGIYVAAEDLTVARELLLADEVEAAFDQDVQRDRGPSRVFPVWVPVAAVVLITCMWMARGL